MNIYQAFREHEIVFGNDTIAGNVLSAIEHIIEEVIPESFDKYFYPDVEGEYLKHTTDVFFEEIGNGVVIEFTVNNDNGDKAVVGMEVDNIRTPDKYKEYYSHVENGVEIDLIIDNIKRNGIIINYRFRSSF